MRKIADTATRDFPPVSYRITIDTVVIECDSPDEAFGLIDRYTLGKQRPQRAAARKTSRSSTANYKQFWDSLTPEARRVLKALAESDSPLDTATLVAQSGAESRQLKYLVRSIKSAASQNELGSEVLRSERQSVDGRPGSVYSLIEESRNKVRELLD